MVALLDELPRYQVQECWPGYSMQSFLAAALAGLCSCVPRSRETLFYVYLVQTSVFRKGNSDYAGGRPLADAPVSHALRE